MEGSLTDFIVGGLSIGAGVIIGVGSGGLAGGVSASLFMYGTGRIMNGINKLRNGADQRIEGMKFNVRSTQAAIPVIYGIMRVGMKVSDLRVIDATDPATPDADPDVIFSGAEDRDILVKVGAFALGSEDGSGIQAIDNIRVYHDGVNAIVSPGAFSIGPNDLGVITKYDDVLKYTLEDGDDAQSANSRLTESLGWGANFDGAGVAYGAFYFLYDEDVWPGEPQITAEITGNRVWDPRTSAWIGFAASGASSDNSALCVLDYLTSKRYGSGVPYAARDGGSLDYIDEQSFIDAANYCDQIVSIPLAATEKRFRTNAAVPTDRISGANLAELLATCRGDLVWQGGKYRLVIRQVTTPETFELTEDNIRGELKWRRKGSSVPNQLEATFPNEIDGEFVADSVVWPLTSDTTFLDEDNGVENRIEVELPYTTSYYQALRTIMVMLREARNDILASVIVDQEAYELQIGEVVKVTHTGPGWVEEEFTVLEINLLPNALVSLSLQKYTAAAFTLDTLNAQPSTPTFNLPDPNRPRNRIDFIYERMQSIGVVSNDQHWAREISWANDRAALSVDILAASYLIQPTLDSGSASPVVVPAVSYHVDVVPSTTNTEFIKQTGGFTGSFGLVDSHILLDNTNNGVAQNISDADGELNSITVELQRTGDPTGDVVMKIYDDSASLPNAVLATSHPVLAASISTGLNDEVKFAFPTPGITLVNGVTYHFAVEYSAGDASNFIGVGVDAGGGFQAGTSKILNGSWVENGPTDMPFNYVVITAEKALYNLDYDEFNLLIGGQGGVNFSVIPFSTVGGAAGGGTEGVGSGLIQTKNIPDYDDVGFRTLELVDRRDAHNETFGSPGPGANDLDMDNAANGFAFDYTPATSLSVGKVGMYLKKTLAPTGTAVCKIYGDTAGLPGALLGTSETFDVSTLSTSYGTNPPNVNFDFATAVPLVGGTLYHVSVEYSGGTASDFVSVAANGTGTNDELNGAWAGGVASREITYRVYSEEFIERIAREQSSGDNISSKYDTSTGLLELNVVAGAGGVSELDDLTDVNITMILEGQILYRNASEFVNVGTLTIRDDGSSSAPSYSFLNETGNGWYRSATQRITWAANSADRFTLTLNQILARDGSRSIPARSYLTEGGLGHWRVSARVMGLSADELRLSDDSSDGDPFLSFYQVTNRVALIQFLDTGNILVLNSEESSTGQISLRVNSFERFNITAVDPNEGTVSVGNAQFYVAEQATDYTGASITIDWMLGNQASVLNQSSTTVPTTLNVGASTMFAGGSYLIAVVFGVGGAAAITTITGVDQWINDTEPALGQGTVGDITWLQFSKRGSTVTASWWQAVQ